MSRAGELSLARRAVRHEWARLDASVKLVSDNSFNQVFRVEDAGERFALRLGAAHRVHTAGTEAVEVAWMDQLRLDGWDTPVAIRTVTGEPTAEVDDRLFTMFTWARGRPVKQRMIDHAPKRLGALMARLHRQAAAMPALEGQESLRSDRVTYMPHEDLVSGLSALFAEAVERAQSTIDDLWANPPHPPHLFHGDIGTHNVMTWRDQLTPIDFQDLQFGFREQDLGITLADLDRGRPGWSEPFLAGYATVEPLPWLTADLRADLRAARSLNIINLGLHPHGPGFDGTLVRHRPVIEEWMR